MGRSGGGRFYERQYGRLSNPLRLSYITVKAYPPGKNSVGSGAKKEKNVHF
jgi:hypothetical protein